MTDEQWSSRFGEVIFGKFRTFPYWPCCIVDPQRLYEPKSTINDGLKRAGKEYTVIFYGETSVGFIPLSKIEPYNEETKETMRKQKIPKKDEANFAKAIQDADHEIALPVEERCKHRIAPPGDASGEDNDGKAATESPPQKKKKGRPAKSTPKSLSLDPPSSPAHTQQADDETPEEEEEKPEEEEEEEEASEEEEEVAESESEADGEEEEDWRASRKRKSSSSSAPRAARARGEGRGKGRGEGRGAGRGSTGGRLKKRRVLEDDDDEEEVEPVAKQEKAKDARQSGFGVLPSDETPHQRLTRLLAILDQCIPAPSTSSGTDSSRALKTLQKLAGFEGVTIGLLKDTQAPKMVKGVAKRCEGAGLVEVAARAKELFEKWRRQFGEGGSEAKSSGHDANTNSSTNQKTVSQTSNASSVVKGEKKTTKIAGQDSFNIADYNVSRDVSYSNLSSAAMLPAQSLPVSDPDDRFSPHLLSADIRDDKLRLRSVRMFFCALRSQLTALRLEAALLKFWKQPMSRGYLEGVARFYFKLKNMTSPEDARRFVEEQVLVDREPGGGFLATIEWVHPTLASNG